MIIDLQVDVVYYEHHNRGKGEWYIYAMIYSYVASQVATAPNKNICIYNASTNVCTSVIITHVYVGRVARDPAKGMGIEDLGYTEGDEKETRIRLERYDMVSRVVMSNKTSQL